jgi:hypothetical protein
MWVNGYPIVAEFRPGDVLIFPLRTTESGPHRMFADEGIDLTIHARMEDLEFEVPPPTARLFILRELANVLRRGRPPEVERTAGYIRRQQNLASDLMPLLKKVIGTDQERWKELSRFGLKVN